MSATHKRFGIEALNWRLTRSAGWAAAGSVMVMVMNTDFPRYTPRSPAFFISRRVCSGPRTQPLRFIATCILLTPYTE